jgi:hypothetical protein
MALVNLASALRAGGQEAQAKALMSEAGALALSFGKQVQLQ